MVADGASSEVAAEDVIESEAIEPPPRRPPRTRDAGTTRRRRRAVDDAAGGGAAAEEEMEAEDDDDDDDDEEAGALAPLVPPAKPAPFVPAPSVPNGEDESAECLRLPPKASSRAAMRCTRPRSYSSSSVCSS
jgi:hypothetical protein